MSTNYNMCVHINTKKPNANFSHSKDYTKSFFDKKSFNYDKNNDLLYRATKCRMGKGKNRESINLYTQAINKHFMDSKNPTRKEISMLNNGEKDDLIIAYSGRAQVYLILSAASRKAKNIEDAKINSIKGFMDTEILRRIGANIEEISNMKTRLHIAIDDINSADESAKKTLDSYPHNQNAIYLFARVCMKKAKRRGKRHTVSGRKHYNEATEHYHKFLKNDPNNMSALQDLAFAYFELDQYSTSIEYNLKAVGFCNSKIEIQKCFNDAGRASEFIADGYLKSNKLENARLYLIMAKLYFELAIQRGEGQNYAERNLPYAQGKLKAACFQIKKESEELNRKLLKKLYELES